MSNMTSFLIGILSSLAAVFVIYLFKSQIGFLISILFYKIYPKIGGDWRLDCIPPTRKALPNQRDIMTLSQFGSKISGVNKTYEGDKLTSEEMIKGSVTPTRMFLFTYESKTSEHNSFGSGLAKIAPDSKTMAGHLTFVCFKCEKNDSIKITLTKLS